MKSLLFLLTLFSFQLAFTQTADEIIQKHFAAIGGNDKWSKVYSVKSSGVYVMGPGMEAPVMSVQSAKPFKGYYSDFTWQGMTSKQAMQGDSGWSYNPFGGKRESDPLSGEDLRDIRLSSDPQGLLFNYSKKGYSVDYLGTDDMDGSDVYKLRLTTPDGDMVYYYIDQETYYIIRIDTRLKLKDKEEKSRSVYSDFRKTTFGITVPFSVQSVDENGNEQGGPVNYAKVEVNIKLDDSLFQEPKAK